MSAWLRLLALHAGFTVTAPVPVLLPACAALARAAA